jgi:hypothetical protein
MVLRLFRQQLLRGRGRFLRRRSLGKLVNQNNFWVSPAYTMRGL